MEGLEKFREAFEAYSENYVIIGGTACDIAMTGTAVRPRATHDIDMIVVVEKMTDSFAERFWAFIREGGIMDDDFYQFTINHSKLTSGIRHADSAALIALKSCAYLNLVRDKAEGKHVNSRDIKKHRSDVLKNVVIMEEDQVVAPASIVSCVKEFVTSIRDDWEALAIPLAKALDQDATFVEALLAQLDELFITEQQ